MSQITNAIGRNFHRASYLMVTCLLLATCFIAVMEEQVCAQKPNNEVTEFLKYFNPTPHKTYLNEKQDRVIKKTHFKIDSLPDIAAVSNKEIGFFGIVTPDQLTDDSFVESLLSSSSINGLSVTVPWQQLEPAEDNFEWKSIDHLLELTAKHNKSIILRVSTAGIDLNGTPDTPKWVLDNKIKSTTYQDVNGKTHTYPIFWDTSYLAAWSNFVQEMGEHYDKNQNIHSIGITGGGILGGTSVIPDFGAIANKADDHKDLCNQFEERLKKDFGMNQKQLVDHWKYVADMFPKAFPTARLNFDISPTTPNRAGQDALDEISDYLIYRYGQRVFVTRENVSNSKHGFDEYRVLSKFRHDTYLGYQLTSSVTAEDLDKLSKSALDDGISYMEVPASILLSNNPAIKQSLQHIAAHMGYQIAFQSATISEQEKSGEPLKASFTFVNLGDACPLCPSRNLDKDVASSYRISVELRDQSGKPVVISLHTPAIPTTSWLAGKPNTWDEQLKMPPLTPGNYTVFMSMIDSDRTRKLRILDLSDSKNPTTTTSVALGKLTVTAN